MNEIEKQTGKFTSFDGTSIYFESRGRGTPIIMIYGVCCQMNHWHHQMVHFSKSYQVITFDIRGHHLSDIPEGLKNLSIAAVAQDLLALMDHLKIEKAHLVGHSFGVPVLIEFNQLAPERSLTYTFINGFAQNPIKNMFGLDVVEPLYRFVKVQFEKAPSLWSELWKVATDNPLSIWATTMAGGFNFKLTQFKDIEIYSRGVSQTPLRVFLPLFEDLMAYDGESALRKFTKPTLIISGEKDAVTPFKFQERMHASAKTSKLVLVPYGSHCTQLDYPDYVNLKMDALFEETTPH